MGKTENIRNNHALFLSVQTCKQPIVWILILGIAVLIWYGTYQQIVLDTPFGNQPPSNTMAIVIWILFGLLMPLALILTRLVIKMDKEKFYYKLFPLHFNMHSFRLEDIESIEPVFIRPILDFGGWGIRFGRKGKGFIIGGKRAVKFKFRTGRPVYFSSERPEEIVNAFQQIVSKR